MQRIDNTEDLISSLDVIASIEELEAERAALADAITTADLDDPDALAAAETALKEWDEGDEGEELADLNRLAEEAEGYAVDWEYGETLIRSSYFRTYAEELAEEIGAISLDAPWPAHHIDWEAAAEELKQDYTAVDFGGVTYWVR